MYNEAWDKAERMMEERFDCCMREIRETRDALAAYEDKFSVRNMLGYSEDHFPIIVGHIKESPMSKMFLAEECIKLNDLIKNIDIEEVLRNYSMNTKEEIQFRKDVEYAKALWNLIRYNIIHLEVFWVMEQEVEEGMILTDEEQSVYDYMRKIAYIYLEQTENVR